MSTVLLKFSSLVYLSAFRQYLTARTLQVDLKELSVRVRCSEKERQSACTDFGAIVLDSWSEQAVE